MRNSGKFFLFIFCILSTTAQASEWSGYGELQSGGGFYDSRIGTSGSAAQWFLAGSGHVSWRFAQGLNLQFDAEGRTDRGGHAAMISPISLASTRSSYGLGAHFDLIDPQYRFGFLASIGTVDNTNFGNGMFSAGIEGAWFFERTTAFAQLVYSQPFKQPYAEADAHSAYLQTGARYFLHDNLMFEADLGAGVIDMSPSTFARSNLPPPSPPPAVYGIAWGGRSGDGNGNMLRWSLGGEYRFADWPISIGLAYRGTYGTWRNLNGVWFLYNNGQITRCNADMIYRRTEHLFAVKLRYYLGQDTLIANDRSGAGTNDYNPWYGAEPVVDATFGGPGRVPAC